MAAQVTVRGMVNPDGSLELEGSVGLPPGQVQVVATPEQPAGPEDWWQYLQRSRAELESSGASFRGLEEIEAALEQIRGEMDKVDAIQWEAEWQKHHGATEETLRGISLGISLARNIMP